jgi:pimeloyl-ACP methyl ester carboxylesterase
MEKSPHMSDFVNANGIRLHYLDWGGNGPALLFLAGLGCNAHIYDGFAPRFTDKFHVLALTRRGHGESDYPETGYDFDTLADDIRQFMDSLGIDQVILVGHSLAGVELSHFAALFPDRVLGLVFLDAAYDRISAEFKAMQEKNPMKEMHFPGENDDYYSIQDQVAYYKKAYPSFASIWGEVMDEQHKHQVTISPDGKVVDKMSDAISKAISDTVGAYVPEDSKIRAPVLNIYAIKENTYYVSQAFMTDEQQTKVVEFFDAFVEPMTRHSIEQFRRDVPHARIVEIAGGHHYCFLKQEEIVFNEMRTFLAEIEGILGTEKR